MDVIELARELGQALQDSPEFTAYRKAEIEYQSDEAAQALTGAYQKKQQELSAQLAKEDIKPTEMIRLRQQMGREFSQLSENQVIAEYLSAKNAAESLLQKVNGILHYYVTGEEEPQGGCSGSCSTCGGCR